MELIAILIKRNNKEEGEVLHFHRGYDIKVDWEKLNITVEEKENKSINIFSEGDHGVNQVYALVGKNGCGKTSILRKLLERNYIEEKLDTNLKVFSLVKEENDYSMLNIYGNPFGDHSWKVNQQEIISGPNRRTNVIYYNPYIGNYTPNNSRVLSGGDISYERRFSIAGNKGSFFEIWSEDLMKAYSMFNLLEKNELNFLSEILLGSSKEEIKDKKEEEKSTEKIKEIKFCYSIKKSDDKIEKELVDRIEGEEGKKVYEILNYIYKDFQRKVLLFFLNWEEGNSSKKSEIRRLEKEWDNTKSYSSKAKFLLGDNLFKKWFIVRRGDRLKSFEEVEEYLNKVKRLLKDVYILPPGVEKRQQEAFSLGVEDFLNLDKRKEYLDLIKRGYFTLDTGFSDGQWAMLKLFASLYHCINNLEKTSKKKEYLILIDEGDMGFHPEWQRRYVDRLVKFLNEIFNKMKFNIILASHSPFIVSDLPTENVMFLGSEDEVEKAKKMKTFGANIHELYMESFFMDSTMGEFAMGKIRGVIEDLTTLGGVQREDRRQEELDKKEKKDLSQKEKEELDKLRDTQSERGEIKSQIEAKKDEMKYIIDSIGERILSRKLEEKYIEVFKESLNSKEQKENNLREKWNKLSKKEKLSFLEEKFGVDND